MGKLLLLQDSYSVTAADVAAATFGLGRWYNLRKGNPATVRNAWPQFNPGDEWPILVHRINCILGNGNYRRQGCIIEVQRMTQGGLGGWQIIQELQAFNNYVRAEFPGGLRLQYGFAWWLWPSNIRDGDTVSMNVEYEPLGGPR